MTTDGQRQEGNSPQAYRDMAITPEIIRVSEKYFIAVTRFVGLYIDTMFPIRFSGPSAPVPSGPRPGLSGRAPITVLGSEKRRGGVVAWRSDRHVGAGDTRRFNHDGRCHRPRARAVATGQPTNWAAPAIPPRAAGPLVQLCRSATRGQAKPVQGQWSLPDGGHRARAGRPATGLENRVGVFVPTGLIRG